jgi:hypothetical protein
VRRLSAALVQVLALPTVVSVAVGVAIAFQLTRFVAALVDGLIVIPITEGRTDSVVGDGTFDLFFQQTLTVVVWGIPFTMREIVSSGLALLALLGATLLLLRLLRRTIAACSDCGSMVPATATVCHACTADLRPSEDNQPAKALD